MTEKIFEALRQQLQCYNRLLKLAEQQHQHVQNNQTDRLLETLQQRQIVLDELQKLEGALHPVKASWSSFTKQLTEGERVEVEALVSESRGLLARIVESDRDDALILQQRKLNVGREMQESAAARHKSRGYAAGAYAATAGASRLNVKQ